MSARVAEARTGATTRKESAGLAPQRPLTPAPARPLSQVVSPPATSILRHPAFAITTRARADETELAAKQRLDATAAAAVALARVLGIPARRLAIRVDELDASLLDSRGARGLMSRGHVLLHARHFDPASVAGRRLLAHELAHLAQLRSVRTIGGQKPASLDAIEAEARAVATAVTDGRVPVRPRWILPDRAVVADIGADARETETQPSTETFDQAVATRYADEIARIKRLLRGWLGFLWVTDGMVHEMLLILQSADFVTAMAIVRALTRGERRTFIDNLDDSHFNRFRTQILALFAATEPDVIREFDEDQLDGMDWYRLTDSEHYAIAKIRSAWTAVGADNPWRRLRERDDRVGEAVRRIEQLEAPSFDLLAAEDRAHEQLRRGRAELDRALQAVRADADLQETLEQILRTLRARPSEDEKLVVLDMLTPLLREPEQLRGVAHILEHDESGDLIERLVDDFPVLRLIQGRGDEAAAAGERRRGETRLTVLLRLLSYRAPWRNIRQAEDLLDTNLFDWIINDHEAYLAHQLARTVPADMREGFLSDHAEDIDSNITQSVRESERWNFYNGGEGRLDQASIQTRLLDERLWTLEHMGELEGVARMAIAAGEHEFVFNQSRAMAGRRPSEYQNRAFIDGFVDPFRLYNPDARGADGSPAPRTEYRPEYLEDIPWYREGVLGSFDAYVIQGLDFVFSSENVDLITNSLGGSGLNAVEFQDIFGGNFLGLRFQSFDRLGAEGEHALETRQGVNFIDRVRWDQDEGVLEMDARNLAIAAIRYPVGSLMFQAGEGRINNLHVRIAYPTGFHSQEPSLDLTIASLEINDTLIIFADSMVGLNRILVRGLAVDMGRDAIHDRQQEARGGLDPGATVFSFLLPGITHLGLVLKVPFWSTPQMQAGLLEPEPATPLLVRWDDLRLEGITTSGGQYIESVGVEDFQVGVAGTRDDYVEMLLQSQRSLTRRKVDLMTMARNAETEEERTQLQARIDRLDTQRESVRQLAQRIVESEREANDLRRRQQRDPAGFDRAASERLEELESFLRTFDRGGMTLDSGRIAIRGLTGATALGELTLTDVHGAGTSGAGILAALTESDTLTRIIEGEDYRPPVVSSQQREEAAFELDLGDVEMRDLRVRESIPSVEEAAGALRDARTRLAEHPWDPALRAEAERLDTRLARTREYHRLAGIGVTYLRESERREIVALREALTNEEAFYAAHIRAEGARLTVGAEGRDIGFTAQRLDAFRPTDDLGQPIADAPGIRIGRATTIGEIHGTDISAGLSLGGGLLTGAGALHDRVTELGLSGTSLEVLDIRRPGQELSIDRAALTDFNLRLNTREGTIEARAGEAIVDGLRQTITEDYLLGQIAALEAKPEDRRSSAENDRLEALRLALDTLRGYQELFESIQRQIDAASSAAERARLEQQLAEGLAMYREWLQQLGAQRIAVSDLGVRVSGIGNPLAEDFSVDDALDRGIVIEGIGESPSQVTTVDGQSVPRQDRMFSSATVTDARFGDTAAARITAGETLGRIRYGSRHIGIENLFIESLAVNDFLLTSRAEAPAAEGGGTVITQIWSRGTSTATGIAVSADLHFERVSEEREDLELRTVEIHNFRVRVLEGGNLGYSSTHNPPDPLHPDPAFDFGSQDFELASGRINGIWATGIRITLPPGDGDMQITGTAGIESLNDARVNAFVSDALEFGHANLNGEHLQVEFLESGERIIDIGRPVTNAAGDVVGHEGGLTISEGDVRTGDGNVRFGARSLRGRIRQDGDVYRLENVRLDSIRLQRFHWRAGDRTFSGERPTTITDVRIDASVDRTDPENMQVQLDRVHVDRVVSEHFRYEQPPLTVEIRQDAALVRQAEDSGSSPPAPLEIVDLNITNLRWSSREGVRAGGTAGEGAVEVEQVHAAFDVLRNAMDLDVVVDADDIDLRFRRDGSQVLTIEELDATARGTAADGVEVDVRVQDLDTGQVSIYPDRIEIPNMVIPQIDVNHLDVRGAGMHLQIPDTGGRLTMINTVVDVDIELDPDNADQPVQRIVVYELQIPEIQSLGFSLTLSDVEIGGAQRDVTISTSHTEPVTITGFRLGARAGGEGFIITPSPTGWRRDGVMHFDRADGQRLAIEIENMLSVSSNFVATNFDLGQIASGDWTLDLERLDLEELFGGSGTEHRFNVSTDPTEGTHHPDAGITVNGLHRSAEGAWVVDSATIEGFVYRNDALGLRIDIRSASLPQRLDVPAEGSFVIPEFTIDEADFELADLGRLSGGAGGGAGASSGSILQNIDFVNAINGTVDVEVDLEDPFPNDQIHIPIVDGEINLNDIENDLGYDLVVDFDLEGSNLVLNIDYGNLLPLIPGAGILPSFIPQANYEALRWSHLSEAERERFDEHDTALLSTLIGRFDSGGGGGGGSPDPDPFVELHNIDANLWMAPTEVNLGSHGVILLGGNGQNAALGIRVTGNIPSRITIAVEQINARLDPTRPLRFGGVSLETGQFVITDVNNMTIDFTGFTPGRMAGEIGHATATNILINRGTP
jgi:hypothetical protein